MSVAEQTARNDYTGNGSVHQYAYTFRIDIQSELAVYLDGVLKTHGTHYTLSGIGDSGGGTVSFIEIIDMVNEPDPPASGVKILFLRDQPVSQLSDYINNEGLPPRRIEGDLDKLIKGRQEDRELIGRGLKLPRTSTETDPELQPMAGHAGKFLRISADEDAIEYAEVVDLGEAVLSDAAPADTAAAAAAGTSDDVSRADHVHETGDDTITTVKLDDGAVTDAKVTSITTRSKLPSQIAYEDESNHFTGDGSDFIAGAGTAVARFIGRLHTNITPVTAPDNTTENDLMSYTLPANTLNVNGKAVRIRVWGTHNNTADDKIIRIYFGTAILTLTFTTSTQWYHDTLVFRVGASNQEIVTIGLNTGATVVVSQPIDPAQDLTANVIIKVTGQKETATDDIVQNGMLIEFIP